MSPEPEPEVSPEPEPEVAPGVTPEIGTLPSIPTVPELLPSLNPGGSNGNVSSTTGTLGAGFSPLPFVEPDMPQELPDEIPEIPEIPEISPESSLAPQVNPLPAQPEREETAMLSPEPEVLSPLGQVQAVLSTPEGAAVAVVAVGAMGMGIATAMGYTGAVSSASGSLSVVSNLVDPLKELFRLFRGGEDGRGLRLKKVRLKKKSYSEKVLLGQGRLFRYGVGQIVIDSISSAQEHIRLAKQLKAPVIFDLEHLLDQGEDSIEEILEQLSDWMKEEKIRHPVGYHIQGKNWDDCQQAVLSGCTSVECPPFSLTDDYDELKKLGKLAKKHNCLLQVSWSLLDDKGDLVALSKEDCQALKKLGIRCLSLKQEQVSDTYPGEWAELVQVAVAHLRKSCPSMHIMLCGENYFSPEEFQGILKAGVSKMEVNTDAIALLDPVLFWNKMRRFHAIGKVNHKLLIANWSFKLCKTLMRFV